MRSRMVLACTVVLCAAWDGSARAQDGLYLSWNDCPQGAGATETQTFACDTDAGAQVLFVSLQVAQPVDSVLGVEIVIDIQHSDAVLPAWWRFEAGGCRAGRVSATSNLVGACANPWPVPTSGGLQRYTVGMPRGGANQARMEVALSIPSSQFASLDAGPIYSVAKILISNDLTTSCLGCGGSACLVLNAVRLLRPPRPAGAPSGDVLVTTPGPGNAAWAGWQMLSLGSCQAVPVRSRTWGQMKSHYR